MGLFDVDATNVDLTEHDSRMERRRNASSSTSAGMTRAVVDLPCETVGLDQVGSGTACEICGVGIRNIGTVWPSKVVRCLLLDDTGVIQVDLRRFGIADGVTYLRKPFPMIPAHTRWRIEMERCMQTSLDGKMSLVVLRESVPIQNMVLVVHWLDERVAPTPAVRHIVR